MSYRKELKKRARKSLMEHYGIWVVLCAIAMFFGGEKIFSSIYTVDTEGNYEIYVSNPVSNVADYSVEFADILWQLRNDDPEDSKRIAQESIEIQKERGKDNKVFGRSRGVFSQVVNRISSGSFLVSLSVGIRSIVGSGSLATAILIVLGLIIMLALWIIVLNTYHAVMARMFMEGARYDIIHTTRALYFIRTKSWLNVSWGMFIKYMYQVFWSFTIVGGVIKYYSYFLVPYILAENPKMKANDAVTLSRRLMDGHKWECFVLQLTFLGWSILSGFTFGLLNLLFVRPYRTATYCEYYFRVRALGKEREIPGVEMLQDDVLVDPPEYEELCAAYEDVMEELEHLERNPVDLGKVQGFFARNFGIVLRRDAKEQAFEDEQIRYQSLYYLSEEVNGHVYPTRMGPTEVGEGRQFFTGAAALRCYSIWSIILLFFVVSFIGWTWEVSLHLITDGVFVNRGVMHGPWLPIYGSGGTLILIALYRFRNNPLLQFSLTILLCGVVEYFTSYILEIAYNGVRWWDYTGYYLNLNGRICGEGLLVFGVGGMAIVYVVAPLFDSLIRKMNGKLVVGIAVGLISLFLIDQVYSTFHPNTGEGITSYQREIDEEGHILEQEEEPEVGDGRIFRRNVQWLL